MFLIMFEFLQVSLDQGDERLTRVLINTGSLLRLVTLFLHVKKNASAAKKALIFP